MSDTTTQPAPAQRLIPNIWCAGTAEEAGAFYAAAIPGTRVGDVQRYPTEGLLDFQQEFAGKALTVDVELPDLRITLINAGDEFRPNPSLGFMLTFSATHHEDPVAALDATDSRLVVAGVRNPYDINQLPGVDNFIATYSYAAPALASLAKVITGEIEPQGKLPVDIYTSDGSGAVLYPFGHGLGW